MRMRRLADGLEIPAGGSAELKPGGTHLMFLDLKEPIGEGKNVVVKLTFKSGATGDVALPVKSLGAKGDEHQGHEGHGGNENSHDHSHH
jgi:copper(I)-binding protein